MRSAFQLFVIVGKAVLIAIGGLFVLVLTLFRFVLSSDHLSAWEEISVLVACFLPLGVATAWILRKLRIVYPRREARALSIAFGLFNPISLGVSMLVPIPGAYALALGGPKYFGLIGLVVGTAVTTSLLSFLVCLLVLRITRLTITVEQMD
jgi:fructose-specific phosphotransferase system IIC component